jgi:hypothetical protein
MAKQVTRCQKILHRPGTILILLHLINNEHVSLSLNPIFSFAVATFTAGQLAPQSSSYNVSRLADLSIRTPAMLFRRLRRSLEKARSKKLVSEA